MTEADDAGLGEPAVAVERPAAGAPVVILCDHASNRLPARFAGLGLAPDDLLAHFAWDPGALAVSRRLSEVLDAPLVHGLVSRLILDVNRDPSDPDSIVETADGVVVPGNAELSGAERSRRAAEVYSPYHAAVDALLTERARAGRPSALIAIHTFTPVLRGVHRPWHCGVIFDGRPRMGEALVEGLRNDPDLVVGVNQPYAPSDRVYHTLARHGDRNGHPAAMLEIRNDLVADAAGVEAWARRLAPIVEDAANTALDAGGGRARPWQDGGTRRKEGGR